MATGRNALCSALAAALAGGLVLLAGTAVLAPSAAAQGAAVWYVDADAAPGGDGMSWASAFRDLQDALAAAEAGDEVWIAEGVYRPTSGADRAATFRLASGVALYGGFEGTEAEREERDWSTNETILSGDVGVWGDSTDNAYHVVTANEVDATAVLDGLTVERGRGGTAYPDDRGVNILAVGGSPTIRHARIRRNAFGPPFGGGERLGGGMYVEGGSPLVEDVVFEENVGNGGGALYASGGAPILRRVTFRDNGGNTVAFADGSAGLVEDALFERNRGASAFILASSPTFRRATFRDNVLDTDGAGTNGAGAYVRGGAPRFEDSLFERLRTNFTLSGDGGAVFVDDGDEPAAPLFLRTTFRENTASSGGAVYVQDAHALFVGCRFERNRALGGGAVATNLAAVTVLASAFVGNRAESGQPVCCGYGGALGLIYPPLGGGRSLVASTLFAGNEARYGGAASLKSAGRLRLDLVNVTLSGNRASEGGGAVRLYEAGDVGVRNAVLWGDAAPAGAEVYVEGGAGPAVERAIVEGGCPAGATCVGVGSADPLFVRAPSPGPDGAWGTADDDYGDLRLSAGSPALDVGLTSLLPADEWDLDEDGDTEEPLPLDAAGGPRVVGSAVDLGAYEGAASAAVAVTAEPVAPPVVVGPEGGSFRFAVTLTNTTTEPVTGQAWTEVEGPVDRSPLLGPLPVTLAPGATLTRTLTQRVPGWAPSGAYTYTVAVGAYPDLVASSASFPVVKAGASPTSAGAGPEGWTASGWDDEGTEADAPAGAALAVSVVPNPTRGDAAVTFTLAQPGAVALAVYDALGRRVAVLADGPMAAGRHAAVFDGSALAAGLYVVRAVMRPENGAAPRAFTRRVTLLR